ncbi:MAG: hypothetical protein QME61_00390 [Patescibacteria group bacterium]|nr:hypothetical protein [Patescibacteria group bacterium]
MEQYDNGTIHLSVIIPAYNEEKRLKIKIKIGDKIFNSKIALSLIEEALCF